MYERENFPSWRIQPIMVPFSWEVLFLFVTASLILFTKKVLNIFSFSESNQNDMYAPGKKHHIRDNLCHTGCNEKEDHLLDVVPKWKILKRCDCSLSSLYFSLSPFPSNYKARNSNTWQKDVHEFLWLQVGMCRKRVQVSEHLGSVENKVHIRVSAQHFPFCIVSHCHWCTMEMSGLPGGARNAYPVVS